MSVAFAPNSTRRRSRLYLDIFDRMHLFLDWRLGRRSIYNTLTRIYPKNETHKILWEFEIQLGHPIPTRIPDLILINNKKKRTCQQLDFAVPADRRVKIKESEKTVKYLDIVRKPLKLWNMIMTVIPTVVGALGTVCIGQSKRLRNWRSEEESRSFHSTVEINYTT